MKNSVEAAKGIIINIQKFCLDDGPGIRTTVFFKGCTMDCAWCHNPESKSVRPQLSFLDEKCILCGKCAAVCTQNVHSFLDNEHVILWDKCVACGNCLNACEYKCLEIAGKCMEADDIINAVAEDKPFYESSNGGITISGGEPLMQPEFCRLLLEKSRDMGIHTCIETAGNVGAEAFIQTAPLTDLYLFDYKFTDSDLHKKYTGADRVKIMKNLDLLYSMGKEVILRCPLIPGVNDSKGQLDGIAGIYHKYKGKFPVEIMPYHILGKSKLRRFGITEKYRMPSVNASDLQISNWEKFLKERGVRLSVEKSD